MNTPGTHDTPGTADLKVSQDPRISYQPTDGLTYDPEDDRYWDQGALGKEITRVFEICHGCRMCFKYCDAFPNLFSLIDNQHGGDVHKLSDSDVQHVMDDCFQCKLCEVQCPYTPRDGHAFQLDFPSLVHRYDAVRAKGGDNLSLRDMVLGDPDASAKVARASLGMANVMNRVAAHRWLMEKALGIHRDKLLPDFAGTTFERWAKKAGRLRPAPEPGEPIKKAETVLFQTCYVQNNEPQIGRDTLEVMDQNGVECAVVGGLGCCGMPAWEHGDLETLRERARQNLDVLLPHVEAGSRVLAINPTCSMMLRREYPHLVGPADRERAKKLAQAVQDPGEYLWSIRNEPRFNTNFKSSPGDAVSYHAPCHLRAQSVGFKGRDLLKKIPGVKPRTVLECCGHDGTFAMTVSGFEVSKRVGERAFEGMKHGEAEVWATECPLAAIQFEQHAGKKALHPMTILARAYRADGFAKKLPDEERGGGASNKQEKQG